MKACSCVSIDDGDCLSLLNPAKTSNTDFSKNVFCRIKSTACKVLERDHTIKIVLEEMK